MIRPASISDIPAIRSMADVVFRQTYRDIISPSQMEYMMDMMYSEQSLVRQLTELGHLYLICEGKGYASYRHDRRSEDGSEIYHLEKLYVMPSEQGSGLGKRLFLEVCSLVREAAGGPAVIELNVNRSNPAVSFYEHMGMHRDRQGDFPIGEGFFMNDYIMAIELE